MAKTAKKEVEVELDENGETPVQRINRSNVFLFDIMRGIKYVPADKEAPLVVETNVVVSEVTDVVSDLPPAKTTEQLLVEMQTTMNVLLQDNIALKKQVATLIETKPTHTSKNKTTEKIVS